ncbi:MAG: helix-turn-helix transcriptional regulator [Anaerolineae bacterium]|nr:helix-turn-helix transcriptional regulator [Anaerolineae bacterium]
MGQANQTSLDDLGFRLLLPGKLLRPYVRSYWYFRRDAPLWMPREEFMHPRAGYGIIFNFGDQLTLDGQPLSEAIFLDGSNTVSRKMGFSGRVELLGVRFHEGGFYPFLGIPLSEVRNEIALLDAFNHPSLRRLHHQMSETASMQGRFRLLDQWLLKRLAQGKDRDPLIPETLKTLQHSENSLSLAEVVQPFAISQRQLERLFQQQVGVTPKQYLLLLRIDRARMLLRRTHPETPVNLATLAADLGYYDQSHFIRQFRSVIGMTPNRYLKRGWQRNP